ncbi:MAG: hypothetical protein H0W02_12215 [Ktedonobacteraceae bacterium]|nr:hypothetical protein [Ktedonobacteraceae bacterium]
MGWWIECQIFTSILSITGVLGSHSVAHKVHIYSATTRLWLCISPLIILLGQRLELFKVFARPGSLQTTDTANIRLVLVMLGNREKGLSKQLFAGL